MTGFYVRVLRHKKWQNLEIDTLTDEELDRFAEGQSDKGWSWAKALAKWIRDNIGEDAEGYLRIGAEN